MTRNELGKVAESGSDQVSEVPRGLRGKSPWPGVSDIRRRIMAAIRSRDTKPELAVRRLLHRMGYRYTVGRRVVGFRPDLVFSRRRKAVFVHGCFWHSHHACRPADMPKTRTDYWRAKLEGNRARDQRALDALQSSGWDVLTLWECEIRNDTQLPDRLSEFLGPPRWE
jgi:DNA mismatch endonuclease Vsr